MYALEHSSVPGRMGYAGNPSKTASDTALGYAIRVERRSLFGNGGLQTCVLFAGGLRVILATTFQDLGIPFPLFEAPADQASEYCGLGTCSLCGEKQQHCFELTIGSCVMRECSTCGTVNGLDSEDRENVACRECGSLVAFPDLGDDDLRVCYGCLRSGKAALTKDTELGMISWEQAIEGVTHGVPGLRRSDFDLVPKERGWVGAWLPEEMMFELLRTPTYATIQGDLWQFCCKQPMVYQGQWLRADFSRLAPDGDGQRFFDQIVQRVVPGLWEDRMHDTTGVYVFQCRLCHRETAHWDIA